MLDELEDFANVSAEPLKYRITVTLEPHRLIAADSDLQPLAWQSIPYGRDEIRKVPDDKRGIYAFAVSYPTDVLPPHGYILYIGMAGLNSNRSLRARYRDYLNLKAVRRRPQIARMIGCWHSILRFWFAPVESTMTSADLQNIELRLNTAFMPPLSINDIDAETRQQRRAFFPL